MESAVHSEIPSYEWPDVCCPTGKKKSEDSQRARSCSVILVTRKSLKLVESDQPEECTTKV